MLLLTAGCSSSSSSSSTDVGTTAATRTTAAPTGIEAAFWQRAGEACRPFRVYDDAHPVGINGLDPEHPTVPQLRRLAEEEAASPLWQPHALTAVVRTLGDPHSGTTRWRRIATDFRHFDATSAAQFRAARAGDQGAWHTAYDKKVAVDTQISVDLYAASAPNDNECLRLFGG